MPGRPNRKFTPRNLFELKVLHYKLAIDRPGLQNAEERQILPTSEGKPGKQNLPRQILPIGD